MFRRLRVFLTGCAACALGAGPGAVAAFAEAELRIVVVGHSPAAGAVTVTLLAPGGATQTAEDLDGDGEIVVVPQAGAGSYRLTISAGPQSESATVDVRQTGVVQITYRADLPAGSRIAFSRFSEEIEVRADRLPSKLIAIPHSVTVVGQAEIEEQSAITVDLARVLAQQVPGLGVSSIALSNFGQSMRGRTPTILVDGVPISTPLRDGARDFRVVAPSALERVEVIRGSTAAYGQGGAGGLINYITRRPGAGKASFHLATGFGSSLTHTGDSGRYLVEGGVSAKHGKFDYLLSADYERLSSLFDAEGDRIPPDPQGQGGLSDTDSFNGLGKLGFDLDANQRVELGLNYYKSEQDTGFVKVNGVFGVRKATAVPGREDPRARNKGLTNTAGTLRYSHKDVFGSDLTLLGLYGDYDSIFVFSTATFPPLVPGGPLGAQSQIVADKKGVRLDIVTPLKLARSSTLLWGLDWLNDKTIQNLVDGRDWTPPMDLNSYAAFAQMEVNASSRLTLRGGARYEYLDLGIDSWTLIQGPRIGRVAEGGTLIYDKVVFNGGAVVSLVDRTQLYAGFSQGFSPADIGRVLRNANITSVATYKPGAATIDNYEIGLRTSVGRARAAIAGFVAKSDLGSQYNADTFAIERAKEKVHGAEATLDVELSKTWRSGATFSWADGERDANRDGVLDEPLDTTRIGPVKLTGYLDWRGGSGWLARLQGLYAFAQNRFPLQPRPAFGRNRQSEFLLLDLLVSAPLWRGNLTLGMENVLNYDHYAPASERSGTAQNYSKAPGRTAVVKYRLRF
jgi:iron complex outermembrane receptor protein